MRKKKIKVLRPRNYTRSKTYALEIVRETRAIFFKKSENCVRASISIISLNK